MSWESLGRLELPYRASALALSGSRANVPLNAAYVHLTSGAAFGVLFAAGSASGLSTCRIFIDATTGTRGNISMRARLYQATGSGGQPTATLIDTASAITYPAADDRWITANFASPPALSPGLFYMVVWDNTASAPATDFPSILSGTNHAYTSQTVLGSLIRSTVNGFSSAGTAQLEAPHILTFANGLNIGQPFTQRLAFFNANTLARGIWFPNALKNYELNYVICNLVASELRIYRSDQLPADTPIYSRTFTADERISQVAQLSPPVTLTGSTDFYVTQTSVSASTEPGCGQVEDYASISAVIDDMFSGNLGHCRGVQDNGSNGWTLSPAVCPAIWLQSSGAIGGGGGGGLLLPRPMNGGYSA